ncbi:MAG: bifunctional UDP-N-acetylmuramoyl-tripeptide:D-alanyl-D-alanine ligase/alanine racemase [Bacteroidetes bacterium]|nr:bifunctional UDP-N-acetylmuramoyl-tripeptide:D-alanyl-D-alanine ligase/alanine racemase [Bacteroidota bacterium]
MFTLKNISKIIEAKLYGNDQNINEFLIDSRLLQTTDRLIFVAIKSQRNNGHEYIKELIDKGVRAFLIEENSFDYEKYLQKEISFIVCKNSLKALQLLAKEHRRGFKIPVIGITGSNGKTTVKEWLYQLLKPNYSICRSPKSYNSQIGVPLSVLNLNSLNTLAIFEAGISTLGEMEELNNIIQPNITIITSIGEAHNEGFDSKKQKLNEKLKLAHNSAVIIANTEEKPQINDLAQLIWLSENNKADFNYTLEEEVLKINYQLKSYNFQIPFNDKASVQNFATCIACLFYLGIKESEIQNRIKLIQPLAIRLEIKNAISNSIIINDFYNSDLDSLKIALQFQNQQNRKKKKMIIVSEIEQSGLLPNVLYKQMATLFQKNEIHTVVGIGKEISKHKYFFNSNALFFETTKDFVSAHTAISHRFSDATILLKGARSFGFEQISRIFQLKSHDTVFEIHLNKLVDNLNYYKSLIKPQTKLMAMVKATGYGSGSVEIARTLQYNGVSYLAVAYADEGVELRNAEIKLPIMVMNSEIDAFEDIIEFKLEPEIYNFKTLHEFAKKLDSIGITSAYPVHIKLDTGMKRLGFEENEIDKLAETITAYPQLKVISIFSHLVASDNQQLDEFTQQQINAFNTQATKIEKQIKYPVLKHICNSSGITRFSNAHFNMVRLGIGLYGVGSDAQTQAQLQNVGVLKTKISQIKTIRAGETIGYNRSFMFQQQGKIATIPIGYADGFLRTLSNGAHGVYVNGYFCKVVGNVCMDMCMIDVTNVSCVEGDEVIIFENYEQLIALSKALKTIPYEVLSNISARVKRIYVYE